MALWQGRWPLSWQRRWWFVFCRSAPVRAGSGNACVFPARAERCHQDPCHPHQQRPAPALGRGGRWPGALAPGWPRISVALWQGRWPLPMQQGWWFGLWSSAPLRAGPRNALRFPRPRAALPPRPVLPAPKEVSARRWRVYRQVGRGPRAFWPQAGQGSVWHCGRGDGPCQDAQGRAGGRVSRFSVRQPMQGARFSTLAKALSMAEHGV